MGHSIYGKPQRVLHRVTLSAYLATRETNFESSIVMQGWSQSQRTSLWSYSEKFADPLAVTSLALTDAAAHVLLVAVQDRPTTQELLDFQLRGGDRYEDQKLPF